MNLKKALNILKCRGWKIEYKNGKYYKDWGFLVEEITPREIVRIARLYTSDNKSNTVIKSGMKEFRHRKNRTKTREDLKHERYDNFGKGLRKDENPWNWS